MTTHEPKCVEWKKAGAALVAGELAGFTSEQEEVYWRRKTDALRKLQEDLIRRQREIAGAEGDIPDSHD